MKKRPVETERADPACNPYILGEPFGPVGQIVAVVILAVLVSLLVYAGVHSYNLNHPAQGASTQQRKG